MTSCIDWPRTASGDCSPIAHRTASVTLDLPEPLGPTMTETPGVELQPRAVGERLEALERDRLQVHRQRLSSSDVVGRRGRSRSSATRAASCSACFFERPEPVPTRPPADAGHDLERPVVRRPELGRDLVGDDLAALRQALLQRRLEVDRVAPARARSPARTPRRPPPPCARSRRAGSRRRSPPRSPRPARARSPPARRRSAPPLGRRGAAAARARRGARRPRGRRARRRSARGSSSAARRRSARPPGAGRGARSSRARARCRPGRPGACRSRCAARVHEACVKTWREQVLGQLVEECAEELQGLQWSQRPRRGRGRSRRPGPR